MTDQTPWEQETLEKLLFETLKEQRRKRRWGIFFKLIFLFLIGLGFFWAVRSGNGTDLNLTKPHTAVIAIHGIIGASGQASAENVIEALRDAYKEKNTKGIILDINSAGGSGVQSSYIFNEVMRLRELNKDIPLYAVCEDYCASAAYYIAASTQAIYANPASLVGSIGAMIDSFGFSGAMEKLGVERRLFISGDNKGFLDPFSPLKKSDEIYAQALLNEVHTQFVEDVKRGRGSRLKITPDIFSGKIWTGVGAKPLGVIDDFGSVDSVARDIIKYKEMVKYNSKINFFDQFIGQVSSSFKRAIKSGWY